MSDQEIKDALSRIKAGKMSNEDKEIFVYCVNRHTEVKLTVRQCMPCEVNRFLPMLLKLYGLE